MSEFYQPAGRVMRGVYERLAQAAQEAEDAAARAHGGYVPPFDPDFDEEDFDVLA